MVQQGSLDCFVAALLAMTKHLRSAQTISSWGNGSWLSPGRQGRAAGKLQRDRVDFLQLLRAQFPRDRFHVLLDLLDAGRAGDHARYLRPCREPGEGELQ